MKNNKKMSVSAVRLLSGCAVAALVAMPSAGFAGAFEDALVATYKNNPALKVQRQVVERADEGVSEALAGWRPSASAGYQKGRQRNAYAGADWGYNESETKSLTMQQPIFSGGSTLYGVSSAKEGVKAARADLVSNEQDILLQAITAYMNVLRDQSVVELSFGNVDVLEKQLQASKSRFAVGEVTKTDVAQSEARLSRAKADLAQAKGSLESSRANFERVIGYKPEKLAIPEQFPSIPATLDEAVAIALAASPDVMAAQHRLEGAQDDISVSRSSILPKVDLEGSMRRQKGAGVRGADDYDVDAAMVNVTVPLYQSGAEYSRIRQSKITASQRKDDLDDKRNVARENTTRAWESLQASIAMIQATEDSIKAAEVALSGVKQEQLYGSRTVLDVLDAEQELFSARVNLVKAQRDRVVNFYGLVGTLGQLNVTNLHLDTPVYDVNEHYDDVKYQLIGY